MSKKYEFVNSDTQMVGKYKLTRIRALKNIPLHGVKIGDLGGYIDSLECLPNAGDCWVGGSATVYNRGVVRGNALVTDSATVAYGSHVSENARVRGQSRVIHDVSVSGNSQLSDESYVSMDSMVFGNAQVTGKSFISKSNVFGETTVAGNSRVLKSTVAFISDSSIIDREVDGVEIYHPSGISTKEQKAQQSQDRFYKALMIGVLTAVAVGAMIGPVTGVIGGFVALAIANQE